MKMKKIAIAFSLASIVAGICFAQNRSNAKSLHTVKTGTYEDAQYGLVVANVVYKDGKIEKILLDVVRNGESSKEKFDSYGVRRVSSLGKEWWEQVSFIEKWIEKNGVDSATFDKSGHITNTDAVSGATITVNPFVEAVKDALGK